MILSYYKNCNFDQSNTGLQYNQSTGKSNSLSCLSGVYDWNGGAKPNKLGDDVRLLGMASGLGRCAFKVNGTCYSVPFAPIPMTLAECLAAVAEGELGIRYCGYNSDYWAGAVKQCGGVSQMPTPAQLAELASQLYVGNSTVGAKDTVSGLTFDANSSAARALGLTPTFRVWGSEEKHGYDAYSRHFFESATESNGSGIRSASGSTVVGICLGE